MALTLDFTGKHVFVFGGTTGINFGIAETFAKHGAKVSVVSRKQDNVDAATGLLAAAGGKVIGVTAEVRDFDAVGRAFDTACMQLGSVDVLVSGAAGNFLAAVNELSPNGFRVVVDIDLIGTFHVMRAAYPHLTKPGAAVINITAPQSFLPMRYQANVCAAKAGVDQMTRVLALEWGGDGIRVNSISPGPIAGTEGHRRLSVPGQEEKAVAAIPLQRMGTKEDIAWLAMFLASPYATYISGAVIPCDGGGALESVKPMVEAAGRALQEEKNRRAT
ncbi:NAD(P)-dependent dehydrogenase, short-chain alcohol dehydrogenase family [Rhizobiales bacterium GAS113]|jgi:NAD(P)-dependent dehydrogenase (short-subunit alcohol dehydrogenase family)|nr:NAD(P)-dependent dehydrogenase, short-chain alcohol dehydrogenase family [Rhizobiales bacterium GAS113]